MTASLRTPALLAGLALLLYLPSVGHELQFSWDDNRYITENEWVTQPSLEHFGRILTEVHFGAYLPVTLVTYALDTLLTGGSPVGYHATNVLLHAANTFLVCWLLLALFGRGSIAILGTLFFLVHPVQVETVSWVSQRKNLLALFFLLVTFLVHVRRVRQGGGAGLMIVEVVAFALSVFSKPIVVGAPLVLLAFDCLIEKRPVGSSLAGVVPQGLLSLAGVYSILTAHSEIGGIKEPFAPGITGFLLLGTRVLFDYAVSVVLPLGLDCNYIYRMDWIRGAPLALVAGALLAVGAAVFAWRQPRDEAQGLFALVWMVVFILPVSNIVPIAIQRADRYLYIPSVMLGAVFGWAVHGLWERYAEERPRRILVGVVSSGLACFALLTVQRQAVWRDDGTLWSSHLAIHPTSQTGILNLGVYHWRRGDLEAAKPEFSRLIRYFPDFRKGFEFMGRIHFREKSWGPAAAFFQKALRLGGDPELGRLEGLAWFNAGLAESEKGNYDEALRLYARALPSLPDEPPLYNNIGFAHYNRGAYADAIVAYERALALDPGYVKARAWLAKARAAGKP